MQIRTIRIPSNRKTHIINKRVQMSIFCELNQTNQANFSNRIQQIKRIEQIELNEEKK